MIDRRQRSEKEGRKRGAKVVKKKEVKMEGINGGRKVGRRERKKGRNEEERKGGKGEKERMEKE